MEKKLLENR